MKRPSRSLIVALAAVALLGASCGSDNDGAATPTTTTSLPPTSTAATTTDLPTTTTVATTTTQATTTTSDLHPAWDVGWAALWPPDGATATYRVNLWGGGTVDLSARVDYAVEWQGGTWDRITLGTVEAGEWGAALYFQRPEPWVLTIWGLEATGPGQGPGGSFLERTTEPAVLDLRVLPGEMARADVGVVFESDGQAQEPIPATYALEVVGLETVEVAAGSMAGAVHLRLNLGGPFFGATGDEFTEAPDIWILPGQLLVKWGRPAPGFDSFELLTRWQ
jgi:hypothetical protein